MKTLGKAPSFRAGQRLRRILAPMGTTDAIEFLIDKLKQVKDNLAERITILKIDVDKNQQLASKYQVRGVPTVILFQNGKQLWRQSGVLSQDEIIKTILEKIN